LPIDDVDDALPCRDDAVDDPVKGAAIQQLFRAARKIPCAMLRRRILALPTAYVFDALATHGEFDKMQSQEKAPET
jgi:hypothetical protein